MNGITEGLSFEAALESDPGPKEPETDTAEPNQPEDTTLQESLPDTESEATESEVEEEAPAVEEPEESVSSPGAITVKGADGKDIALPADAKITVTVDGREKEITIADFRDRLSSHVQIQRKLEWMGKQEEVYRKAKEGFEGERDRFAAVVNGMHTILQVGGPEDLAEFFGSITNTDPNALLQHWVKSFHEALADSQALTPEQRQAKRMLQKSSVIQHLQANGQAMKAERERRATEEREIAEEIRMYGFNQEELDEATGEFFGEYRAGRITLTDQNGKPRGPDRYDMIDYALKRLALADFQKLVKIENEKDRKDVLDKLVAKSFAFETQNGRRMKPQERKKAVEMFLAQRAKKLAGTTAKEPVRGKPLTRPKPQPKEEDDGLDATIELFSDNFGRG